MTYDVLARAQRASRRRMLRTVAMIVTALAACFAGIWLAVNPAHDPYRPSPSSGLSVPGGPVASSSAAYEGQLDPGSAVELPGDLTWSQVAGLSVPVSAQNGPHRSSDGLSRGFTRDRAGAVLAAVNLVVRVTPQVGPAVFGPTLRAQVVGPNAEAFREQVDQQYQQLCAKAGVKPGQPVGRLPATLRGYRIDLYSDTNVLVRVMTETDRSGTAPLYAAAVVQLAWTNSDWALVAPTGGVWDQSITEVAADNVGTYNPFNAGR